MSATLVRHKPGDVDFFLSTEETVPFELEHMIIVVCNLNSNMVQLRWFYCHILSGSNVSDHPIQFYQFLYSFNKLFHSNSGDDCMNDLLCEWR